MALPRMTTLLVPAYAFFTDATRIITLPLTCRVPTQLLAFSTLAAWFFNNILCPDLLPVYRFSSPYAEQQKSPPRWNGVKATGRKISGRSRPSTRVMAEITVDEGRPVAIPDELIVED